MGGSGFENQAWRGLVAAVLLGIPAVAVGAEVEEGEPPPEPGEAVAVAETTEAADPVGGMTAVPGAPAEGAPGVTPGAPAVAVPDAAVPAPGKKKKKKSSAESLGEDPEGADAAEDAAAKTGETPQRIRVSGRVFARASADEREEYVRSISIPSARVGVEASLDNVDAEVSADLAGKSLLRDAFVRLSNDSKQLRLYGGRFKSPFLQRSLESAWALPIQERGLVEDYLTETNDIGGRRLGLMGEVRLKEVYGFKLSAGVFEGGEDADGERLGEDASARLSVRPFKALTVGASTYLSQVFDGTRRHALAADAELRLGGLSVTGEAVTGRLALGPFTAQLLLASWTVPVGREGWALQPVVGAEALQLRGDLVQGEGHSLVGGFNVLLADSFKAQFQAERALRPGDEAPGLELSLQLATRFK